MQHIKLVSAVCRTASCSYRHVRNLINAHDGYFSQILSPMYMKHAGNGLRLFHASNSFGMADQKAGVLSKVLNFVGLGKTSKSASKTTGFLLYETIGKQVQVLPFFKALNMPDTFHSWFVVTGLHVWMLMARLMAEGDHGRMVRNAVVEAMWQDVEHRSKQLGEMATSVRRKQIGTLVDEFQASLFSYDEGLLSSDKVLAGALWRNVFFQQDFDPRQMEMLVTYVRKTMVALDSHSQEDLLYTPNVKWIKLQV